MDAALPTALRRRATLIARAARDARAYRARAGRPPTADDALHASDATPARWRGLRGAAANCCARDIFGKKETERRPRSSSESRHLPARTDGAAVRGSSRRDAGELRLLYAIMAYDRKQHIHLLTMLHCREHVRGWVEGYYTAVYG